MAATWSIVQLDYTISLDGETNVVTNIHWDCNDFIAYDDITEENAVAWLKAALGDDGVSAQEDAVAAEIAVLKTPVNGSGKPW